MANSEARKESARDVKASDVDHAARSIIEKRNFGEYFIHRTGHGLGLEIHEDAFSRNKLKEITSKLGGDTNGMSQAHIQNAMAGAINAFKTPKCDEKCEIAKKKWNLLYQ